MFAKCVSMMVLKHKSVPPYLKELIVESGDPRNVRVRHVYDTKVCSATEKDSMLLARAEDCYVKSPTKPSQFHLVSLYKLAHLLLQEL